MDLNDLNKVWEIKPLKKIGEEDARRVLEKVAKQVQPIMKKRKWKVKILSEFCPANPALMGLNIGGGAEVKLRLRRPNNEWDFFPYEQVLDTMLHELCHNEFGPHNSDFYNLLDEIRKECEELMAKGISGTGQGFDLHGRRLGGFSRQPPLSSLRQSALAAAENRARRDTLLPSGPKRVGGDSNIKAALSPIQAAAMAAERRLHDDLWCGSKSSDGVICTQGNAERAEGSRTSVSSKDVPTQTSLGTSMSGKEAIGDHPTWQCKTCTLLNQPMALICEACGTRRHKEVAKFKVWSCKFCTLDNSVELDRCIACGEWRYSYGPPELASFTDWLRLQNDVQSRTVWFVVFCNTAFVNESMSTFRRLVGYGTEVVLKLLSGGLRVMSCCLYIDSKPVMKQKVGTKAVMVKGSLDSLALSDELENMAKRGSRIFASIPISFGYHCQCQPRMGWAKIQWKLLKDSPFYKVEMLSWYCPIRSYLQGFVCLLACGVNISLREKANDFGKYIDMLMMATKHYMIC
ncbi:unnamed protein product [Dovyalis caffra]|uniref:Uncharacterized protein n=1 Tax=Dovyalis caffra TaxID=77055 RepID=A0AAV1QVJ8_9ROSI|nr:unnamed protein product [Dovyalis caffra]